MGKKTQKHREGGGGGQPQRERDDTIEFRGVVQEALPGTLFRVLCEGNVSVLATLSGKIRTNRIRVLPNDSVTVEVSVYDPTRGRITWRDKN